MNLTLMLSMIIFSTGVDEDEAVDWHLASRDKHGVERHRERRARVIDGMW